MRKVLLYSLLLVAGLIVSQFLAGAGSDFIKLATMFCLSFIMIHVGYEFEIDKSRPKIYALDYGIAATAAAFPWIFCALYFVFVMMPSGLWGHPDSWKEALLTGRFSSPTSAGVLFSMLAAAGLAATWVFKKARILAIFDDLDTILLMIPLKIMMVGFKWQLAIIIVIIVILLWMAWRYLHVLKMPISWPFVMLYAAVLVAACELIYIGSKLIDKSVPIHLEVLLPAFVLGCMLARPAGANPHSDDHREGHEEGPESPTEQRVSTIISAAFMIFVGLSMPAIINATSAPAETQSAIANVANQVEEGAAAIGLLPDALSGEAPKKILDYAGAAPADVAAKDQFPGWGMIAFHVLMITLISNLGKMFPAFCYRKEAHWKERLAVAIGMFPRGEVGAGVLVISISYGISGPALTVAVLSLALNLLLTGVFILIVKKLIASTPNATA